MQANRNIVHGGHKSIDIISLPEAAQQELFIFYEFLLFKYHVDKVKSAQDKKAMLKEIFQEANGRLPSDYSFDREEIHER